MKSLSIILQPFLFLIVLDLLLLIAGMLKRLVGIFSSHSIIYRSAVWLDLIVHFVF